MTTELCRWTDLAAPLLTRQSAVSLEGLCDMVLECDESRTAAHQ